LSLGINHFLVISAIMLGLGLYTVITGKNLMKIFAGLILLFAAPLLNIASVSGLTAFDSGSQIVLFILSAVVLVILSYGISLLILYHRAHGSFDLDSEVQE